MKSKLIIHGGFFSEADTDQTMKVAKQQAIAAIVREGYNYLLSHSAIETVEYTVSLLEDCDLFNAGLGSQIQSDGKIRLSALIMDGDSGKFGGVINVRDVKNPVKVATLLMNETDNILSDDGAVAFARQHGFGFYNPETPSRRADFEKKVAERSRMGTVGCVAFDSVGRLAAATSTGGKGFEIPYRVSDSATVAGNYANEIAAVSCTGVGEDIVRSAVAAKIVTRVTDGFSLEDANKKTFDELNKVNGFAGAISIDRNGNVCHIESHPYMVWGMCDGNVSTFD